MTNKKKGLIFIIVAILIFIGTIILYNKDNQVYNEISSNFIDIDATNVDEKNNSSLVSFSGTLDYNDEKVLDDELNISVKTPVLKRNVEVFVWVEEEQTENNQTSYVYKKEWRNDLVDSTKFHFQERYENPTKIDYNSKTFYAEDIKVGVYDLTKREIESLTTTKTLKLENINKKKLPKGYKVVDNYITNSSNIESPEVGDIRITYQYNNDEYVSILAKLNDNKLTSYKTKNNKEVDILLSGKLSGEDITNAFKKDSSLRNTIFIIISLSIAALGFIYISKEN